MGLKLENGQAVAASLMIYDAQDMTPEGRKLIAAWLRRQARFLSEHGDGFNRTYRARYLYAKGEREPPQAV